VQLPAPFAVLESPLLLDPRTAALNQNDQHDNEQNARDNLNDRGTVHDIPLSLKSKSSSNAPLPFWDPAPCETKVSISPSRPARGQYKGTTSVAMRRRIELTLLDPGAAALYQNDKHNNKQHARDNLNDRGIVHEIPLSEFLAFPCFLQELNTSALG
jgi:hypothetical protein